MKTELEQFNDFLKDKGGITIDGKPKYRLVWSEDCFEVRLGTFRDYSDKIFLREVTEYRKTLKYSYIKERWIIEGYIPEFKTEYMDGYEPIYVYETGNRVFLTPTLKSLEFFLWAMRNPARIKNASDYAEENEKKKEKAINETIDMLGNADDASVQYALGERISMAGIKQEKDTNDTSIN